MARSIKCVACGASLKVPEGKAGKKGRCPTCGAVVPLSNTSQASTYVPPSPEQRAELISFIALADDDPVEADRTRRGEHSSDLFSAAPSIQDDEGPVRRLPRVPRPSRPTLRALVGRIPRHLIVIAVALLLLGTLGMYSWPMLRDSWERTFAPADQAGPSNPTEKGQGELDRLDPAAPEPLGYAVTSHLAISKHGRRVRVQPTSSDHCFVVIVATIPAKFFVPDEEIWERRIKPLMESLRRENPGMALSGDLSRQGTKYCPAKRFRIANSEGVDFRAGYLAQLDGERAEFSDLILTLSFGKSSQASGTAGLGRKEYGIACEIPKRSCKPPFKLHVSDGGPIPVPSSTVAIPAID